MTGIKVLYVIGGLGRGGAEKQLYLLLKYMDRELFTPTVVSLSAQGPWADDIRGLGVRVVQLSRRRSFELGRLLRLYRVIQREEPTIIQTFLFSDNVYGLLAGWLAGVSIRIASRRIDQYGESRVGLRLLSCLLGQWADAVICNTARSRRYAPAIQAARHVVIPNGIEPWSRARSVEIVRRRLRIPVDGLVVGNVGRLVRGKNHRLFLELATEAVHSRRDLFFLLVGGGPLEPELRSEVRGRGLEGRVILTGERGDVADLMGAMDIFVLTSDREGMSNAIMEAMMAGLPCVVTDAGGNSELVINGETGYVCRRGDKADLLESLQRLLGDPGLRRRFGESGRQRMETRFSAEGMAKSTQTLYRTLLTAKNKPLSSSGFGSALEPVQGVRK